MDERGAGPIDEPVIHQPIPLQKFPRQGSENAGQERGGGDADDGAGPFDGRAGDDRGSDEKSGGNKQRRRTHGMADFAPGAVDGGADGRVGEDADGDFDDGAKEGGDGIFGSGEAGEIKSESHAEQNGRDAKQDPGINHDAGFSTGFEGGGTGRRGGKAETGRDIAFGDGVQGFKGSRVQEFKSSRVQGFKGKCLP